MKYLSFVLPIVFMGLSAYYNNWWISGAYAVGVVFMAVSYEYYKANEITDDH